LGFAVDNQAMDPYRIAFLDWLACAIGGSGLRAARAAAASGDRVLALAAAGHVLDFDDTYAPGLAHLSAATAPAVLAVAADAGATVEEMLAAYADGFETMAALARASHPALYDGGWHPTAVCGSVGAAVAAARLLDARRDHAVAIALLRIGGFRAAFGSDGKALQVGMAASTGVLAARLARAGAEVPLADAIDGFEATCGGSYAEPGAERAVTQNWIKAWPCCLQTHSAIEAADRARAQGLDPDLHIGIRVHPVSLQAAAHGPRPADGLQAKFSIPYLVAHTLLHGPPRIESFERVDPDAAEVAGRCIEVAADRTLGESEAILSASGSEIRVEAALGSPQRPMEPSALNDKLTGLAGGRLDGVLENGEQPAEGLIQVRGI
jgi:2-methylcitrate dehydratase PrpD